MGLTSAVGGGCAVQRAVIAHAETPAEAGFWCSLRDCLAMRRGGRQLGTAQSN